MATRGSCHGGHPRLGPVEKEAETLTSIQAACGRGPAHDGGDGPHDRPHPRVGDADPLERGVAAGVQENVEEAQGTREWVNTPGQQGDSGNRTACGEGHGEQRAGRESREHGSVCGVRAEQGQLGLGQGVSWRQRWPGLLLGPGPPLDVI